MHELKVNLKKNFSKFNTMRDFAEEEERIIFTDRAAPEKNIYLQKIVGYIKKSKKRIKRDLKNGVIDTKDDVYVILYHDQLLKIIDNYKKIYVDATFKSCPNIKGIYQLMTIMVDINGKVVFIFFNCNCKSLPFINII